ncbi:MAG: hypothetical protein NTW52_17760 [Planctomycetota bacterium]|nr:hypothetical protein [Planctomycetota bacterium]
MANRLIEPTLLFDFSINLKSLVRIGSSDKNRARPKRKIAESTSERVHGPSDWDLDQSHELPNFAALAGYANRATVWAGWAMDGMYFKMKIAGKSLPPRFFGHSGGVSDGLRVWIDTRSSPGVHRATRFCHCFHFFPGQSAGMKALASKDFQGSDEARGVLDSIPRFREAPNAIEAEKLFVSSHMDKDGYTLWSHVPASCLTGYAPEEFDAISLFVEVVDFELGTQSISLGPELRYVEDPSLWIRAELTQ